MTFGRLASLKKKLQKGADLGERMQQAFETAFDRGYKKSINYWE